MKNIIERIWDKYLGVNTPEANLAKEAAEQIGSLERKVKELEDKLKNFEANSFASKLPKDPTPGLLMSMAIRFDHGLGCPGYYDSLPIYDGCTHAQRLESTLSQMRQLYEEVSGYGFYKPELEEKYAEIAKEAK